MDARHAAATPYQQRIWKVTNALDRLAVLCEQHHLQTKHVDGLPDWTVPKVAAGVASRVVKDTPPNFAWHDAQPVAPLKMTESESEDTEKPTIKMDKEELSVADLEQDMRVTQELRASTSELLSRLAPPSLRSSVSSTTAPVFPQSAPQSREDGLVTKATSKPVVESYSRAHSSTESSQSMSSRYNSRPASAGSVREAGEPHRRRKVQFADHGRSYRGDRPTRRMVDLTYHEALRAITPTASTASSRNTPEPRTTYQQTYQWPRREAFVEMMEKVGGQTAGGETWYEPRRVFTAEDALVVAKESARDLLKKRETSPQEQSIERLDNGSATLEEREERQMQKLDENAAITEDKRAASQPVTTSSAQQIVSDVKASSKHQRPKMTLSKPVIQTTLVEASTQTDTQSHANKPSVRIRDEMSTTTAPAPAIKHSGYCSHCGRSGDVEETKTTSKEEAEAQVRQPARKRAPPRPTRVNPQRDNPIFLNPRYPSEPPVFRAKSTYSTVFGKHQIKRR